MDAKVTWKNKMAFEGFAAKSGFSIPLDTSLDDGGDNSGFRPMELLMVGLAGCTAMDVISILKKKKQEVSAFEVRTSGERATEHPRIYTNIEIEYVVTGKNIDAAAVERAVDLSEEKYCSAQAMLAKAAKITHKITIIEG
jgi:putative redox protein